MYYPTIWHAPRSRDRSSQMNGAFAEPVGMAEAGEAREKAEKRWNHLEGRINVLGEVTRESLEDIGGLVEMHADEIRRAYQHLRRLL